MATNLQKKKVRQEKILFSLDKLGFASRSQLQRIHNLGSNRNACRVLKDMEEFFNVTRMEENIYYLNKRGRERIGSDKALTKNQNLEHHLMRNDAYIFYGCPDKWTNEYNPVKDSKLIPDAFFFTNNTWKFLEVDNLQKMSNNRDKVKKYAELKENGTFQKNIGHFPTLVWVTNTVDRQKKLKQLSDKYNIHTEVYIRKDLL